jgi:hypothetical protein
LIWLGERETWRDREELDTVEFKEDASSPIPSQAKRLMKIMIAPKPHLLVFFFVSDKHH